MYCSLVIFNVIKNVIYCAILIVLAIHNDHIASSPLIINLQVYLHYENTHMVKYIFKVIFKISCFNCGETCDTPSDIVNTKNHWR